MHRAGQKNRNIFNFMFFYLSSTSTNILLTVLGLWRCEKHFLFHIFHRKLYRKSNLITNSKLRKEKVAFNYPVSGSAENHLKIYRLFINVFCYIYEGFSKNCINVCRTINVLFKNANFSHTFFHI